MLSEHASNLQKQCVRRCKRIIYQCRKCQFASHLESGGHVLTTVVHRFHVFVHAVQLLQQIFIFQCADYTTLPVSRYRDASQTTNLRSLGTGLTTFTRRPQAVQLALPGGLITCGRPWLSHLRPLGTGGLWEPLHQEKIVCVCVCVCTTRRISQRVAFLSQRCPKGFRTHWAQTNSPP